MTRVGQALAAMPVAACYAAIGAALAGVIGAIVGLAVGIVVYAPTAWFALFELGIPAAFLGAVIGLLAGRPRPPRADSDGPTRNAV